MGGKWPGRLANMCAETVGVYEDREMELYHRWKVLRDEFVSHLCFNDVRQEFTACLNVEEQGELVRDEINDMISSMGDKEEL